LQFTIKYENDGKLSFMDLLLEVVNNVITVDWFHEETFSGRYLLYHSNHPQCHKIEIIYNLVDRAILLFHPKYQKNLEICIKLLLENSYPLSLIFNSYPLSLIKQ